MTIKNNQTLTFVSWSRIILINILILFGLLITVEVGTRFAWTVYSCNNGFCNFSRLSNFKIYNDEPHFTEKNIGLSRYDEVLGYVPAAGFSALINAHGWRNALVTISPDGFRSNDNNSANLEDNGVIIAVGDSFTFGDQVGNVETWPSCLERKTNHKTLNAGVFGYGAAQALRRASLINNYNNVDTIILSLLVNDDFHRDRMKFRSGFPRPAVIKTENGLSYAKVPPIESPGTKWKPTNVSRILSTAKNYSMLLVKIMDLLGFDKSGMRRTEIHEDAADINKIIEFTIKGLLSLEIKNKFIVLQYDGSDFPSLRPEVVKIKDYILSVAELLNIPVIDTYNRLQVELLNSSRKIWYGHHTPYGNALVCDEIYQHIQNNL